MATYYKWRKSTIRYAPSTSSINKVPTSFTSKTLYYIIGPTQSDIPDIVGSEYNISDSKFEVLVENLSFPYEFAGFQGNSKWITRSKTSDNQIINVETGTEIDSSGNSNKNLKLYSINASPGFSQGYVYSTSSSTYPNEGASGSYYYDQRTTVVSPTVASNLTYPKSLDATTQSSIKLQWTGAQSNTDYPVTQYEVSYAINNTDSWQVAGTTGVLTYEFSSIPEEATSIAFRVRAKDSNNKYGDYVTGTYSTITREPPITVVTKNIEMNYFNGTDYEILYPVVGSEVYNHVKSGNYVGSGQYGQSNPNKLTLEFTPKVAMITKTSGVYDTYLLNGKTVSYVQSSTGVSEITVEWTGQTVSWYSSNSVEAQLNENGVLYAYVAFG